MLNGLTAVCSNLAPPDSVFVEDKMEKYIENVQREGVHELDEALGYKALIQQNPDLYTVETIAAKVGRSP